MRARSAVVVVMALVALVSCSSEDDGADVRSIGDDPSASGASASGSASASVAAGACPDDLGAEGVEAPEVHVALDDFSIEVREDGVAAGPVVFEADNVGAEPHEIVVARLDAVSELVLDDVGFADEAALPDGSILGELEAFSPGLECKALLTLEPGTYVLFCNVGTLIDGVEQGHAGLGMATTLDVTA